MNIGAMKGAFVTNLIADHKPSVMIELGGYVGYSAILFGDAIRANGGKQFLSIEKNPEVAAVANQLVDLAGLRDIVRILVGASDEVLLELVRDRKEIAEVEMIFIDHWQRLYRPDLWLLEELDVLVPGTSVLVADNVIMPGAPEYLEWVKATTEQKRELVKKLDVGSLTPNPNLVYETTVSEFDTDFGKVCLVPSMDF
jgi:catechol O-methyltransferase